MKTLQLDKTELLKLKDLLEKDHYRIEDEMSKNDDENCSIRMKRIERAMVSNLIIMVKNEIVAEKGR